MQKSYLLGFVLLVSLAAVWGVSLPLGKLALREIDPWAQRAVIVAGGGVLLLTVSWLLRQPVRPSVSDLVSLAKVAAFNIAGWHILLSFGLRMSDAADAIIIADTMPIWATILGVWMLGEAVSIRSILALTLAISSLVVLIGGDLQAVSKNNYASVILLFAAISWAYGTVLQKLLKLDLGLAAIAGWQLLLGSVPIILGMVVFGSPNALVNASSTALLATYASLPLMVFCYWAWFKVVSIFPVHVASIGVAMAPVFGVMACGPILGEQLGLKEWSALVLIVAGLVVLAMPNANNMTVIRKLRSRHVKITTP